SRRLPRAVPRCRGEGHHRRREPGSTQVHRQEQTCSVGGRTSRRFRQTTLDLWSSDQAGYLHSECASCGSGGQGGFEIADFTTETRRNLECRSLTIVDRSGARVFGGLSKDSRIQLKLQN